MFQNSVPVDSVSSVAVEVHPMLEAEKYRQYAKDCERIAASMSGKDRQTLL